MRLNQIRSNHTIFYALLMAYMFFFGIAGNGFAFYFLNLTSSFFNPLFYLNLLFIALVAVQIRKQNPVLYYLVISIYVILMASSFYGALEDWSSSLANLNSPISFLFAYAPFLILILLILFNPSKIDARKAFEDRDDLLDF